MIKQGINTDILEKKFKILRTSIMLGNIADREATLKNYEKTAREVDDIRNKNYEELLAGKMYMTTTLKEEASRLAELIDFIQKRIDERNEFTDDYIKITANFLDDLPKIENRIVLCICIGGYINNEPNYVYKLLTSREFCLFQPVIEWCELPTFDKE